MTVNGYKLNLINPYFDNKEAVDKMELVKKMRDGKPICAMIFYADEKFDVYKSVVDEICEKVTRRFNLGVLPLSKKNPKNLSADELKIYIKNKSDFGGLYLSKDIVIYENDDANDYQRASYENSTPIVKAKHLVNHIKRNLTKSIHFVKPLAKHGDESNGYYGNFGNSVESKEDSEDIVNVNMSISTSNNISDLQLDETHNIAE